jgi:hypothetical protein
MSFSKNNSKTEFYILKFLIEKSVNFTKDREESILDKNFCYVVAGTTKINAIKTFLLQDISGSILSISMLDSKYYYNSIIPSEIKKLNKLIKDNNINDIDPQEDDEQEMIYSNFINENIDLIIQVLLTLEEKSILFRMEKYNIII